MNEELPKIMCKQHSQYPIQSLQVNGQPGENLLLCRRCEFEKNRSCSKIQTLTLSDLHQNDIILSWPYIDQEMLDHIDQIVNYNKATTVSKFFDDLKESINEKLDKVKKKMVSEENNFSQNSQNILKNLQDISELENVIKIIYCQKDDFNVKSQKIQEIFSKLKENQKINTGILQQQLDAIGYKTSFDEANFRQIKESILNQIILFDQEHVSKSQAVAKDTEDSMRRQGLLHHTQQEIIERKIGGHLDYILNFVFNKANQCKQEYLISLERELLSIQHIINNLNISQYPHESPNKREDIDLSGLYQNQIDGILNLILKMRCLNGQYPQENLSQNQISSKLQPSSKYIISNILQHDKLLLQSKISKIESDLRNFPIFEICNIIDPSIFDFEIQKSSYNNSKDNVNIKLNEQNKYQISNTHQMDTISYIKLNQEDTYKICLQFNFVYNDISRIFYLGLISNEDKDTFQQNTQLLSTLNQHVFQNKAAAKIILEIQFCIKNKYFQIHLKNQAQNQASKIDFGFKDGIEYFLTIHMFKTNQQVSILEFDQLQITD
ncbi:hypothetical protein ABPG72_015532 [Tetrahymena utriculariae]